MAYSHLSHSDHSTAPESPFDESLYQSYLQALLCGHGNRCQELVNTLLSSNLSVHDLYVHLFQRSLYEVGSLWESNKISVSVEHLATALTERLMSLVYPRIFSAPHNGKKAVVSCVANELHQIGGRMVADVFELNGWDGYFLGANTPIPDMCSMLELKQPQVLALSLSIYFNMEHLYQALGEVQQKYPHLPVIVGGQAFRWGGTDIENHFSNVTYMATLQQLEHYIQNYQENRL
ncbi:cobalamin B12-binding domain-containing protein [Desulfurispira natronophila]|uniref:Methanogenic corrinoid protein MtbC1 n=1 Tax=Desulfurispira natronophila TaxID=682562 RepID=A0A7W7Y2F4_9BACT|nr:cobalamin-dependent protein [Desulfurispira natronophila]MBB5020794.1 methanogenic corrinoid protein MtbC1 [Desulfurispira natronophila]